VSRWHAHPADEIELGVRAERALRFSFITDIWVENDRHDPDKCICYLLPVFFNHKTFDACDNYGYCSCTCCRIVRKKWRSKTVSRTRARAAATRTA
jgi:hypothetical protein